MILCVGEILADVIDGKRHAGGAPFNVACDLAAIGAKVGFYGAVGRDGDGAFLTNFASMRALNPLDIQVKDTRTTTAIVTLQDGERSFRFVSDGTDSQFAQPSDSDIERADIVHIGSLAFSSDEGERKINALADAVKAHSKLLSFDVNYREGLSVNALCAFSQRADIIKLSADEIGLFTMEKDPLCALKNLFPRATVVALTLGANGAIVRFKGEIYTQKAQVQKAVDTTGAGDAFMAGLLCGLDGKKIDAQVVRDALKKAVETAAIAVAQRGAIIGN